MHNSSTRLNPRKMAFIMLAFSKLRLRIHGKKFLTCNNVSSFNKVPMANVHQSSTLVDRESTHPPLRTICNLIFPTSSSHRTRQMVIRAFTSVSPPSLRSLAFTLLSSELCTQAVLKMDACCLTLQSHISFYCLSLCLYPACLKKSTEKASVSQKAFIFKTTGVHSSLERSVKWSESELRHCNRLITITSSCCCRTFVPVLVCL